MLRRAEHAAGQSVGNDDALLGVLKLLVGVGAAVDKPEVVEAVEVGVGELHRHRHFGLAYLLTGAEVKDVLFVHVGTDHLGTVQAAEHLLDGQWRIAGVAYERVAILEMALHIHRAVAVLLGVEVAHAYVQDEGHHHSRGDGYRRARDVDGREELVFAD